MKTKVEELLMDCIPDFIMPNDMDILLSELDGWDSMASFILLDKLKEDYNVDLDIESIGLLSISDLLRKLPNN